MCYQTLLSRLKNDMELHAKSIFNKYKVNTIPIVLNSNNSLVSYDDMNLVVQDNEGLRKWADLALEEQAIIADELSRYRR